MKGLKVSKHYKQGKYYKHYKQGKQLFTLLTLFTHVYNAIRIFLRDIDTWQTNCTGFV